MNLYIALIISALFSSNQARACDQNFYTPRRTIINKGFESVTMSEITYLEKVIPLSPSKKEEIQAFINAARSYQAKAMPLKIDPPKETFTSTDQDLDQ